MQSFMPDLHLALELCSKINTEQGGEQKIEVLQSIEALVEDIDLDEYKEDTQYLFTDMDNGVERISKIIKGLRLFANLENEQKGKVNLKKALEASIMMIKNAKVQNSTLNICARQPPSLHKLEAATVLAT